MFQADGIAIRLIDVDAPAGVDGQRIRQIGFLLFQGGIDRTTGNEARVVFHYRTIIFDINGSITSRCR